VRVQADFDTVVSRHGDFVEGELEEVLLHANAPAHVLEAFQTHAADRKALCFTPTVATAYAMTETFQGAGIAAEALDGSTPLDERRAILSRLRTGITQVVCNCAVLAEGFDEPSLDCIIVARPTHSQPFYQQMIGRGTRTYPGKRDCLILDVVGVRRTGQDLSRNVLRGFHDDTGCFLLRGFWLNHDFDILIERLEKAEYPINRVAPKATTDHVRYVGLLDPHQCCRCALRELAGFHDLLHLEHQLRLHIVPSSRRASKVRKNILSVSDVSCVAGEGYTCMISIVRVISTKSWDTKA
jgi:hypothetical protein